MIVPLKADHLSSYFGIKQRERGTEYYRLGRVNVLDNRTPNELAARVKGTQSYSVAIEKRNNTINVSCSCPNFGDFGACKHVWATLLTAEEHETFTVDESKSVWMNARFDPDNDGIEDIEDKDILDDNVDQNEFEEYKKTKSKKSKAKVIEKLRQKIAPVPKVPRWADVLARLSTRSYSPAPPNRLLTGELRYSLLLESAGYSSTLEIETSISHKDELGGWKPPKASVIKANEFVALPDQADRAILLQLFGAAAFSEFPVYHGFGFHSSGSIAKVSYEGLKDILPLIISTGRFYLKSTINRYYGPCVFDPTLDPWDLSSSLSVSKKYDGFELTLKLVRGKEQKDIDTTILMTHKGFVFFNELVVSNFRDNGLIPLVPFARHHGTVFIPREDLPDFYEKYLNINEAPPIEIPSGLQPQEITAEPKPIVRVHAPNSWDNQNKYYCEVCFAYNEMEMPAHLVRSRVYDKKKNLIINRDVQRETGFMGDLAQAGITSFASPYSYKDRSSYPYAIPKKKLPAAISLLLAKNWKVEADGSVYRKTATMTSSVASSGADWFDLTLTCQFDGVNAPLPALLAALEKGEQFVRLGDGSYGMLPEDWMKKIAPFARMGKQDGDVVRFNRSQTLLLDMLLCEQEKPSLDATFKRVRDELRTFSGITKATAPASFHGTLRPYQEEGLGWLYFLKKFGFGGCLADDMGLGKTIQVLALFAEMYMQKAARASAKKKKTGQLKPSLIVAPRSLIFNWMAEAERFVPGLKLVDFSHAKRNENDDDFSRHHVVLITYGTLRRDIEKLMLVDFEYVVLDEAQSIKNSTTVTAKAARLLKANYRLALSGTPVENHLGELWSILEFLNPGMLGSSHAFSSTQQALVPSDESTIGLLRNALRPFILRRTKTQVAPDLPKKQEESLYCEMEAGQRKLYNELRDHYRASLLGTIQEKGMAKSKILILEALLRLRQAACHPALIHKKYCKESSAKLEALFAQLDEVIGEGHKALIFSQFTSLLALVKSHLDKSKINYEYLDGQTKDRQERVQHFQSDTACPLFLISLKAGGVGLNLTAAEYVFLLDPWWNPAVEAQAIDRTHRIGQTKPVFAYRLICKDTVEEKILEMQKSKRQLADSIISADSSILRTLKEEDLRALLS